MYAPAIAGLALAAILAWAAPQRRLYVTAAPALVAAVLGIAATAGLLVAQAAARATARRQAAAVGAADAAGGLARRRFVQRLDHELKNPLTALLTALSEPATGSDLPVAHAQARGSGGCSPTCAASRTSRPSSSTCPPSTWLRC